MVSVYKSLFRNSYLCTALRDFVTCAVCCSETLSSQEANFFALGKEISGHVGSFRCFHWLCNLAVKITYTKILKKAYCVKILSGCICGDFGNSFNWG